MKKYRLTGKTLRKRNKILKRVQAVRDFGNVKEGQLGGWVEGEWNLSHDGDCWVDDEAMVLDNAKVEGNACVSLYCEIKNSAIITDNAIVRGNGKISENAKICGNAKIFGVAKISGNAIVGGNAVVENVFTIKNNIILNGNPKILDEEDIEIFYWHPEYPIVVTKKPEVLYHCGGFTGTQSEFVKFMGLTNF